MLKQLYSEPHTKPQLEDALDVSRSTINRGIQNLQEESLVEYKDGEWGATVFGQHAVRVRNSYLEKLASLEEVDLFLDQLAQKPNLSYDFLSEVAVHKAEAATPCKVLETLVTNTTNGTALKIISPRDMFGCTRVMYNRLREYDQYELELVVSEDVLASLDEVFPDFTHSLRQDCNSEFHHAAIPFTFGLWIVDETQAGAIIYSDYGIAGLLVNDSSQSIEWAKTQFQTVKNQATEVTATDHAG